MSTPIVILSLLVGVSISFYFFKKARLQTPVLKLNKIDFVLAVLFILFCGQQFLHVCFEKNNLIYSLNQNNLGDLSLHVTYINNLAHGAAFWPANAIYAAENLHYPFGVDLFTAMFVKCGIPLTLIMPVMGLVATSLTLWALLYWSRGFAVGAFLFSGGLAGAAFFFTGVLSDYLGPMAWKNIVLTLFVPQRGFLLAFPLGLTLLWSWRKKFINQEKSLPLWVEGLLWGTLPLIHFHSFIFMSFIFAVWSIFSKNKKEAFKIVLWAIIPATLEVWLLTEGFTLAKLIWIKPGWMIDNQNPFLFLIMNYGVLVPLILGVLYITIKNKDKKQSLMLFPALIIYIILFFIMLAPWTWDNTKMMVWCYLLLLPPINELILQRLKPYYQGMIYVLFFFSGFISLSAYFTERIQPITIYNQQEVGGVCDILNTVSIDEPLATFQTYNHPVNLCGYKVVAGYPGHLWSHGIRSVETESKLKRLMNGEVSLAQELKVRYIFWGPREQQNFAMSSKPWETQKPVAENQWGKIYELR